MWKKSPPSTKRNMSPFNKASAEVSLTTNCRSDVKNLIQWQSSFHIDKDRLGKNTGAGVSPAPFW